MPGVKAVILAGGEQRKVSFYGQELAAVAATTKQQAQDAIRVIEVTADPLPFVVKEDDAMKPNSPPVTDGPNLSAPKIGGKEQAEIDALIAAAPVICEAELRTPVQIHHPLETHGNTVSVQGDHIIAWASTQGVFSVRDGLAGNMGIPQSNVQVICDYMGGGFGAKFGPGAHGGLAAQLSQAAECSGEARADPSTTRDSPSATGPPPSRISSSRQECRRQAPRRRRHQPRIARHRRRWQHRGRWWWRRTLPFALSSTNSPISAVNKPNVRSQQYGLTMNTGASSAFRAPGHPPASFGTESMMDELAVKLNMDPLQFRLLNDPDPEPASANTRKVPSASAGPRNIKSPAAVPARSRPVWVAPAARLGRWRQRQRSLRAQINPDGTVEVRCGTQDLGHRLAHGRGHGGRRGIWPSSPTQIKVKIGDTTLPFSGGSGGSSTTPPPCLPPIWDACQNALTAQMQTQTGVADARGANWFDACKKLGINPLTAQGKWQRRIFRLRRGRRELRRGRGRYRDRPCPREKNRRRP